MTPHEYNTKLLQYHREYLSFHLQDNFSKLHLYLAQMPEFHLWQYFYNWS